MSEITIKEALENAKEKEKLAYDFYKKLGKIVSDLGAKSIIKELAEEEVRHKELLEKAIETGKISDIGMNTKCYYTDLGISKIVLPEVITEDLSVQDILRIAMKHEDNSRLFYEKMAKQFEGEEAEELFRNLAVEESCHRNNIQEIYDDIVLSEN